MSNKFSGLRWAVTKSGGKCGRGGYAGAWGFPQILPHHGLIQHQLHGNKAVLSMLASNPEGPAPRSAQTYPAKTSPPNQATTPAKTTTTSGPRTGGRSHPWMPTAKLSSCHLISKHLMVVRLVEPGIDRVHVRQDGFLALLVAAIPRRVAHLAQPAQDGFRALLLTG